MHERGSRTCKGKIMADVKVAKQSTSKMYGGRSNQQGMARGWGMFKESSRCIGRTVM
jgi:hypothetical protein